MSAPDFEGFYRNKKDPWGTAVHLPERYRLRRTLKLVSGRKYGRCIDVGCGEGEFTRHLVGLCNSVTGIDVSATAIKRARSSCREAAFRCGDVQSMGFNGKFDLICCLEMLYYLDKRSRRRMLSKFFELLRPGGVLLVSAKVTGGNYFSYGELLDGISSKFEVREVVPVSTRIPQGLGPFRVLNKERVYSAAMLVTGLFPRLLAAQVAVLAVKK